jgi:hypothetical protein
MVLEDARSKLGVTFSLRGSLPVEAELADGYVVYPQAQEGGADILRRPSETGAEDYINFPIRPGSEEVVYDVVLGPTVAGLRVVANVLELVDAHGAPRLRVAPPYVIASDRRRIAAEMSIRGCAIDTDPSAPWNRPPVSPGSRSCALHVGWQNKGVSYPALVDPEWASTAGTSNTYFFIASNLMVALPGGRALIGAGGANANQCELYDAFTGTWASTGTMNTGHQAATLTVVDPGRVPYSPVVLAIGTDPLSSNTSTETYDPTTGKWTATTAIPNNVFGHTASAVANGTEVLVAGGLASQEYWNAAYLYNAAKGTWSQTGSMNYARFRSMAVTLSDGRVMEIGGKGAAESPTTATGFNPGNAKFLATTEIFDPSKGTWTKAASLSGAPGDVSAATLLANGDVLVAGGSGALNWQGISEEYTPTTDSWAAAVPSADLHGRAAHAAITVGDGSGDALLVGGISADPANLFLTYNALYCATTGNSHFFDLLGHLACWNANAKGTWVDVPGLVTPRTNFSSAILDQGQLLIAGGQDKNLNLLTSSEVMSDPALTTGIHYGGGPLLTGTPTVYAIFYGDWTGIPATKTILTDLVQNLSGSIHQTTMQGYYDSQHNYVTGSFKTQIVSVPIPDLHVDIGHAITAMGDPTTLVKNIIDHGLLPNDPTGVYVVLAGDDVVCPLCIFSGFGGYHWTGPYQNGGVQEVAFVPYLGPGPCCELEGTQGVCPPNPPAYCNYTPVGGSPTLECCESADSFTYYLTGPHPAGDRDADNMAVALIHELNEAITDSNNGWNGYGHTYEEADECEQVRIANLAYFAPNGQQADAHIGGYNYWTDFNLAQIESGYALCLPAYKDLLVTSLNPYVSNGLFGSGMGSWSSSSSGVGLTPAIDPNVGLSVANTAPHLQLKGPIKVSGVTVNSGSSDMQLVAGVVPSNATRARIAFWYRESCPAVNPPTIINDITLFVTGNMATTQTSVLVGACAATAGQWQYLEKDLPLTTFAGQSVTIDVLTKAGGPPYFSGSMDLWIDRIQLVVEAPPP